MICFVGYDSREHVAFQVLENNLVEWGHTVIPIKHKALRDQGKFNREWLIQGDGQYIDGRDLKPFSTEFTHSRFAAIPMARGMGISEWCMFCDTDFLFRYDPKEMLQLIADQKGKYSIAGGGDYAIACVKHDWHGEEGIKMDGMLQLYYHRKLWSSMFLFRPLHYAHNWLTWQKVNWCSGQELHSFKWVDDDLIGELPAEWNYIPAYTDTNIVAKGIHWSYGGPWMPGFRDVEYAEDWRKAYHATLVSMVDREAALDPYLVEDGRVK